MFPLSPDKLDGVLVVLSRTDIVVVELFSNGTEVDDDILVDFSRWLNLEEQSDPPYFHEDDTTRTDWRSSRKSPR